MDEFRRAIIKPIRKASHAWEGWPDEMLGNEYEAKVFRTLSKFFARIDYPPSAGSRAGIYIAHGEAELVRFLED